MAVDDVYLGKGRWWSTPPEAVIERYDRDGTLRANYTDPNGFGFEHGATTDDGLTVFAVGYIAGSPPAPRIFKFDAETLSAPSVFIPGTYATDRTLNLKVRGGTLYCGQHNSATSEQRIQQFDFDGALLNTWMVGGPTAFNSEAAFDVVGDQIFYAAQTAGISHVERATLGLAGSVGVASVVSDPLAGVSQVYDVGVFLDGKMLVVTYDTHYLLDSSGVLSKTFYQDNGGHFYVAIDGAVDETQYLSLPANTNIYEGGGSGAVDLMDIDLPDESSVDQPLFQITAEGSGRRSSAWVRRFGPEGPPEPPVVVARNLMPRNAGRGRLGCGVNRAYLTWKCGAPRYCSLPDSTEITYSRALDDISEATVVVTLSGSGDEECCDCLGNLEPWCHELHIARDGEVVWLGPVTEVFYDDDKVTINAVDLLGWATERVAEVEISNATMGGAPLIDLSEFGREILNVAFAEDDPCALDYLSVTASGLTGARTFAPYIDTAFDQLDSLAQTGAPEYTVVGRTIILTGTELPATPIATLLDTHIIGPVRLTKAGLLAATRWFVHYNEDDTDIPPGPGVASAAEQHCYGLLEKIRPNDAGIPDKESAEQAATILLGGTSIVPRLLEVPEGSQLSPEAPWTIDKMIPGARVDVSVNRLCVDATQSFKLTGVSVHQAGGDEEITVTLGPINIEAGL